MLDRLFRLDQNSIAQGIGAGFVTCAAIKALVGRYRSLNAAVLVLNVLFPIKIAELGA